MQLNLKKNKFKNRIKTPILITGSTGFIGANLTRKLPKEFLPLDGGHAKPDFINYLAPLTGKKLPFTTTIQ